MTITFFQIIDFLRILWICYGYTDTSIDTKKRVACLLFKKVIDQLVTPTPKMILLWWWAKGYTRWKPMRSTQPHTDNFSNKQLWNLLSIPYSIEWIIFATCLTKNTTIDISMPHWHFMQLVATRGSATRPGIVFYNTGSYKLPYILQK